MEPAPYGLINMLWIGASLAYFLYWMKRTRSGDLAFAGSPVQASEISLGDVLGAALVYFGISLASVWIMQMDEAPFWTKSNLNYLVLSVGELILSALIITIARARFPRGLQGFGLAGNPPARTLIRGLGYALVSIGLVSLVLTLTLMISRYVGYQEVQQHLILKELFEKKFSPVTLVLISVMVVLIAPFAEELLFRGMIQNYCVRMFTRRLQASELPVDESQSLEPETSREPALTRLRWKAIALTAVIFAVLHSSWQHWPALFVFALALGYVYERYKNLWMPILMHALFNGVSLGVTLYLAYSGSNAGT